MTAIKPLSQKTNCGMRYVLLKPNIVHIKTIKSDYHGATGISIDRNDCAVLIFNDIWAAPNSHS